MARSRFLIMKSVAVSHLCSKHSSIEGRFLEEKKRFWLKSYREKLLVAYNGVRLKMNIKNLEASGVTSR